MNVPILAGRVAARATLVIHPRRRDAFAHVLETSDSFRALERSSAIETLGDQHDPQRIRNFAESDGADVVIAAGGDGTVASVAGALLEIPRDRRPDLAILPLGTANNVARSFGLLSVRVHGADAIERSMATVHSTSIHPLDMGRANGAPFVGSIALGLDGAILTRRNALRRRLRLGDTLGGYPLYLASCAVEGARHRSLDASIEIDGSETSAPMYNLLVTTCPLYAGEFRFSGPSGLPPERLSLHRFETRRAYLSAYIAAWRRHVNHTRRQRTDDPPTASACRKIDIRLSAPVAAQIDGEEASPADQWQIEILPSAVGLRRPPSEP